MKILSGKKPWVYLAFAVVVVFPAVGFASWLLAFCNVVASAMGPIGAGIASIGIIIISAGAILGRVSWGMAITVTVGLAAFFTAPAIVERLTDTTVECEDDEYVGFDDGHGYK